MARNDPQVNLRIPAHLKDRLDAAASDNKRSLTAEVVHRLEASFLDVIRLPEDLRRKLQFHAASQQRSMNEEVIEVLGTLYPEIPEPDELLQEIDDLISRAEDLERMQQYDAKNDSRFQHRISEHIGRLRERIVTLLTIGEVDKE